MEKTRLDPRRTAASPPAAPELRALGDYRFLRRLGEGGMGEVYLAYHEGRHQHVAVKVLPEHLHNADYLARFHREARSGAALNHPNIVRTLGAAQDKATGRNFLVMEYVDGTNALALVQCQRRLPIGDVVRIGLDIARALEHAHSRNVIHRDIKPDNILITRSGVAKLVDFGLAKRTDEVSNLTAARQGFGTTHYMPYEQAMSARQADGRSDIYALGATLYHLATGVPPFTGENHLDVVEKKGQGDFPPARSQNPEVPRVLDHILRRMLARLPEDRYQTASELIVDLERSRLASDLLSFADKELALRDPWVQACLAANAQPTRPDLRVTPPPGPRAAPRDVWLVRYTDPSGKQVRGRATTRQIAQRLRDGKLPPTAEVCRAAEEGFLPATFFADFDEANLPPAPERKPVLALASSASATAARAISQVPRAGQVWLLLAGCLSVLAVGAALWTFLARM